MGRALACTLIEVVVCSVVKNYLGNCRIPSVKPGYAAVGLTEDGSDVGIESSFLSGKHSHTRNSLGDSTCAGVAILYELNGLVGGMDAVHRDVSLILVVCGIVAVERDVSAKLGFDNSYCCVSTPGTTDCGLCGLICCTTNALVSGELTLIEYSTVGDSILCSLVRALEGGKVACCALIILNGIDYVDCTVLKECGVVSTKDEIGVTRDKYVLKILTAGEELESILNTEKGGIPHNESVCLNEKRKTSFNVKTCRIHSLLAVPVVGNCNALNSNAVSAISDGNCLSRVGNLCVSACVLNAVDGIPLDGNLICANALDVEVGDSNFNLFGVETLFDDHNLALARLRGSKEVESLLNGGKHIVSVLNCADGAGVGLVYHNLISILYDRGSSIYNVNRNVSANLFLAEYVGNREFLRACGGEVNLAYLVCRNVGEGLNLFAKLTVYCYIKTCEIKGLAYCVNLLEALVNVGAVTCRGLAALNGTVKAKFDAYGKVYVNVNSNGLVVLVAYSYGIYARSSKIHERRIYSNVRESERLGLAVCISAVKLNAGDVKLLTAEVINDTLGNKLEAVLVCLLNDARKRKVVDVLGAAILAAFDDPFALGNINFDLN